MACLVAREPTFSDTHHFAYSVQKSWTLDPVLFFLLEGMMRIENELSTIKIDGLVQRLMGQ